MKPVTLLQMLLPTAAALTLRPMTRVVAPRGGHAALCAEPEHADSEPRVPKVTIEYCTRCNWMLRSAWMQQELLTTFNGTIAEVSLVPNHTAGGIFEVTVTTAVAEEVLWDRSVEGRLCAASASNYRRLRDSDATVVSRCQSRVQGAQAARARRR
jgi:selenoprotein W-related protein